MMLIFSLSTPLGVVIGALISGQSDLLIVIFNSLASGTFVYIACSEILVEEMNKSRCAFLKLLMTVIGVILISVLSTFVSH